MKLSQQRHQLNQNPFLLLPLILQCKTQSSPLPIILSVWSDWNVVNFLHSTTNSYQRVPVQMAQTSFQDRVHFLCVQHCTSVLKLLLNNFKTKLYEHQLTSHQLSSLYSAWRCRWNSYALSINPYENIPRTSQSRNYHFFQILIGTFHVTENEKPY